MDGVTFGETLVDLPDRLCVEAWVDGRRSVAKIDSDHDRWRREVLALRTAAAGGVAVPDLSRAEPGVLVLAWVDGRPLDDVAADWRAAGAQLRRLHGLSIPGAMPRFDADSASWVEFVRTWVHRESALCVEAEALGRGEAAAMAELLLGRLADLSEPPRVQLHGDCAVQHVLVGDSGGVTLIDWGDAGTGDPLWDLAVLLLFHPQHEADVLDGYDADPEMRRRCHEQLDVYRLVRFLGEITWLVEHGIEPTGSVAGARRAFDALEG